jgi:hypothetical protein
VASSSLQPHTKTSHLHLTPPPPPHTSTSHLHLTPPPPSLLPPAPAAHHEWPGTCPGAGQRHRADAVRVPAHTSARRAARESRQAPCALPLPFPPPRTQPQLHLHLRSTTTGTPHARGQPHTHLKWRLQDHPVQELLEQRHLLRAGQLGQCINRPQAGAQHVFVSVHLLLDCG